MATTLFPGVALVTGAASGIGRGIAIAFAREGCERIVIADHNEAGLEETSRLIKSKHSDTKILVKAVDVRQEERVAFLVQQAVQEFGRIDYAVNAAGILGESGKSHEMSTKAFDDVLAIDYRGCWLCSRQELKQMLSQDPLPTHDGRPGNRGDRFWELANKQQYSKDNIRINCVCPGVIETPMVIDVLEYMKPAIKIAPMESSKATFVQGAALVVDGGYTIN
ncbi:hypothetical protein LTR28_002635 [Elasticomyces elasticus]|nr:hypothetical protein LTR28_002635 [Elasticomyces elasticus]